MRPADWRPIWRVASCGLAFCMSQRPPRTLPWDDVRRILRSIEKKRPPGKRDFAIILLLATYGLGAAEVLALRLEDLDWKNSLFRTHRPKTKALIELPLLPAVARALTDYLRRERPPSKGSARVFLRKNMPYEPMTSGAIRHRNSPLGQVGRHPGKSTRCPRVSTQSRHAAGRCGREHQSRQ